LNVPNGPARLKSPALISGLTLVADQLTKYLVVTSFNPGDSLPLLPHILHLTYVQNTGAAFGLFKGQQALFIGLSLLVIAWIVWELLTKPSMDSVLVGGCALVLGGSAGNLIDRLTLGYVVDFIDVRVWPVFNAGDSAITIGVVLLIWRTLRRR
jgi:signal peptidase II